MLQFAKNTAHRENPQSCRDGEMGESWFCQEIVLNQIPSSAIVH